MSTIALRQDASQPPLGWPSPTTLAADERFWSHVREGFDFDTRYLALNAAANNTMQRGVREAYIRNIQVGDTAPLTTDWEIWGSHREAVRASLASMANCSPEELALTRNATEGLNIAVAGRDLGPGDEIVALDQTYPPILDILTMYSTRTGTPLRLISTPHPPGALDELVDVVVAALGPRTKVLFLTQVIDGTGQIFPIRPICDAAHEMGIRVVVDGALSFGSVEVDLAEMGCDYFATSLHKGLHAPSSTGFLYVQGDRIPDLWPLYGHDKPQSGDIRKLESVGRNPAYPFAAVGQALDYHLSIGTTNFRARHHYLKRYWADQLAGLPGVHFHTSLDHEQSCAIALVEFEGVDHERLRQYLLRVHRIQVWRIDHAGIRGLWVAPFFYNQPRELDRMVEVLDDVAGHGIPDIA